MPISETEARELVRHLETTVREIASGPESSGIVELLDQWRSDVEAGRLVERKVTVRQSPGLDEIADVPRSRTTTSGEFLGKEEYNNIEQLEMLVTALGIAFVAPQMMATRFLSMIESCEGQAGAKSAPIEARFVGVGDTDETAARPAIAWGRVHQSREATSKLLGLLEEISTEAGFAPRRLIDSQENG